MGSPGTSNTITLVIIMETVTPSSYTSQSTTITWQFNAKHYIILLLDIFTSKRIQEISNTKGIKSYAHKYLPLV